jgi:Beta-propeller repeat
MKAAFLAVAMLAMASVAFYFATGVHAASASGPAASAHTRPSSKSLSLPLFFEPNQGQTAPQVKFLAHGAGYGLFLTADEAVLELQHSAASHQPSGNGSQLSTLSSQDASSSVIRMKLDGANSSARISGASPMPGKSSYLIGNDPSKWHRDIPQFGRVQYQAVYPGIDLVYYGDQGQLEYDFRVAPAADPNQIALSFKGASTRIDSGDLVLSTASGDVRFRAPHVYQRDGNSGKAIAGGFRQLADNKIGFTIGDYDHNRELVIDPILSYSTYLGGGGTEGFVKIAVDSALAVYVAGSTDSANFPVTDGSTLKGSQNIFISKINPLDTGTSQLVYSVYLGGSQTDSLSGIAVDTAFSIYVAGSTNSPDFPTTSNAFQTSPAVAGTHGFLSKISLGGNPPNFTYGLSYSTYLAGSGTDRVTGLAIDSSQVNAYVTGDTTSYNQISDGFPANPNAFQKTSNSPGNPQFFATQINTSYGGSASMIYSTYFGGSNPAVATAVGGGIAVDPTGSNVSMYFTGTTNMLPQGLNGGLGFPLYNAQQSCLNEASQTGSCNSTSGNTDAFVAKLKPVAGAIPSYSTYLGGSGTETGIAIAVDTSSDAYVTGATNSGDWAHCIGVQCSYNGVNGASNAYIAKIGTLSGSTYPLNYFTYLGGTGPDSGQDIKVDSLFAAHLVGSTTSPNLPANNSYQGQGDAFVALIATNSAGSLGAGDYVTYLGGNQLDQGTGIALDTYNATYVAGNTLSPNFPTVNPYQPQLNGGSQDAFVSRISAQSTLQLVNPTTSPSPHPVAAGSPVAFTFDIINKGPDNATFVTFVATVPTTGVASNATAKVTSNTGSCGALIANTISCSIPTLAACTSPCTSGAAVEVDITPSITGNLTTIQVSGIASANNSGNTVSAFQIVTVVDFKVAASTSTPVINAGDTATVQVNFCPTDLVNGYSGTITPSQTTSPSMVTATTPTFNPTTATLSGTACSGTTLSIATVARPVTTGSLFHRGSFYAAWLPIGGLSLVGLGLGAGRKRRRWLLGAVLGVIAGMVLLQVGCGSSSSSVTTVGGTAAGTYTITVNGSAGTGASHSAQVNIRVN